MSSSPVEEMADRRARKCKGTTINHATARLSGAQIRSSGRAQAQQTMTNHLQITTFGLAPHKQRSSAHHCSKTGHRSIPRRSRYSLNSVEIGVDTCGLLKAGEQVISGQRLAISTQYMHTGRSPSISAFHRGPGINRFRCLPLLDNEVFSGAHLISCTV